MLKSSVVAIALVAVAISASVLYQNEKQVPAVSDAVHADVLDRWNTCIFIEGPHGDHDRCAKFATKPLNE